MCPPPNGRLLRRRSCAALHSGGSTSSARLQLLLGKRPRNFCAASCTPRPYPTGPAFRHRSPCAMHPPLANVGAKNNDQSRARFRRAGRKRRPTVRARNSALVTPAREPSLEGDLAGYDSPRRQEGEGGRAHPTQCTPAAPLRTGDARGLRTRLGDATCRHMPSPVYARSHSSSKLFEPRSRYFAAPTWQRAAPVAFVP